MTARRTMIEDGVRAGRRWGMRVSAARFVFGVVAFGLIWAGCAAKPVASRPLAWQEADRLSRQASRLQAEGNWVGSLAWWERAARQFQLLNDGTNLAMAWHNEGVVHRAMGQPKEAVPVLERAAELNQKLGQTNAWWRNQITLLQVENDLSSAAFEARVVRLQGDPGVPKDGTLAAIFAHEQARAWMRSGRLAEGLAEAERAASVFLAAGDRMGVAAAGVTRAKILRKLRRWDDAVSAWREVLGYFEALGDPRGVAVALAGWGGTLAEAGGNREEAEALLSRAEENYRALGMKDAAGMVGAERAAMVERKTKDGPGVP